MRRKEGAFVVHLVNNDASPALSPRRVIVEHIAPVSGVIVRLRLPQRPSAVRRVPYDDGLSWQWAEGWVTMQLATVAIHTALAVEL